MPKPHHAKPHHACDIWVLEGQFRQLIYSPRGSIEGLLIETEGIPTQFVTDPQDPAVAAQLSGLQAHQTLRVEGSEIGPSPKGEAEHFVYRFERLAAIDGREPEPLHPRAATAGKVLRFNYARHGAPNGVVLDNGDFVHTKPGGIAALGLKISDKVRAEGLARTLATGLGRVIEARQVNGQPIGPAH